MANVDNSVDKVYSLFSTLPPSGDTFRNESERHADDKGLDMNAKKIAPTAKTKKTGKAKKAKGANFASKTIWTGDNLNIMRGMNSECVDLIYLDPPFNSNRTYEAPIGSKAAGASFKDAWTLDDIDVFEHGELADRNPGAYSVIEAARHAHGKSMQSYLIFMAVRLLEMHRVLKPTGTIYLHCDTTASHYLKLLLDGIFGRDNFRNEVVWCYRGGGVPKNDFARKHDIILRYSKTKRYTFNKDAVRIPYSQDSADRLKYKARAFRGDKTYDKYEQNPLGKHPEDWWEMQPIMPSSKERTGYPTQKPLALVNRIILASSNEGDMVLDPFCGCATTLVAAYWLDRQWTGIDLSPLAIKLVDDRITKARGLWGGATALKEPPRRTDLGKLPNYRTHRHELYGKQEGVCVGCDTHFPFRVMEVDHIVPQSKHGTDHIENLQMLCSGCNRSKGNKTMAEWRAAQAML